MAEVVRQEGAKLWAQLVPDMVRRCCLTLVSPRVDRDWFQRVMKRFHTLLSFSTCTPTAWRRVRRRKTPCLR